MFPKSISLITLGVRDLERSRAFYAALGWKAAKAPGGVVFIQLAGQVLGLFPLAELAKDMGRPGAALGFGAVTLARNFSTEAEVDAAFALALAAGASAVKRPEKVFWGGYSGYFADPDGHLWELAMNPGWPLGPDGTLTLPA
jgi:catechol 2,3-dioxygenase-like lactoylglutathione lyase family enzyme